MVEENKEAKIIETIEDKIKNEELKLEDLLTIGLIYLLLNKKKNEAKIEIKPNTKNEEPTKSEW